MSVSVRAAVRFQSLPVASIEALCDDAVVVTFAVPPELRAAYAFQAGQHLTVRRPAGGLPEVRRSYSICSTPDLLQEQGLLRIGVREMPEGVFSRYAVRDLRAGDMVETLPPLGSFGAGLNLETAEHYGAVVAGSGITPVLSLVATTLLSQPASRCTVIYGNRRASTVMFADELADLKDRYPGRFHLVHVLSREPRSSELLSGRLDAQRLGAILTSGLVDPGDVDQWFLCGPYGMVMDAESVLAEAGVPSGSVHKELFFVEDQPPPERVVEESVGATATVLLHGRSSTVTMAPGERVLDAALRVRSELPYSCRSGVCSTCRARLIEGQVSIARDYALEPADVAAGYVLTCQATPISDHLVVDYDA
jgi:ring-1,2-phenylacetyl-CoA epoxidase subunit PaaE